MPGPVNRVTMKMIAERAGTSIGTVDRALNNRGGVNERRKQQILSLAQDMGYSPNRFASALSRRHTVRIGMVYPRNPCEFYDSIAEGITAAAQELQDYGVAVEQIRYEYLGANEALDVLHSISPGMYDGLAVNATCLGCDQEIDRLTAAGVPVVTFNTDAPGSRRLFYVGDNSRQMGRLAGELMAQFLHGHGTVAILGNFGLSQQHVERFGGFCEYAHPQYPDLQIRSCMSNGVEQTQQSLGEILNTPSCPIHGVFSTGYRATVGAIRAIRAAGRRDVYLIGFDMGEEIEAGMTDGWCTALLFQNPFQQGYQAAHMLAYHLLDDWLPDHQCLYIEPHIVLRSNLSDYSLRAPRRIPQLRQLRA